MVQISNMNRREYLATASVGVAALSGCLNQISPFSSCKLHHEVSKKETVGGYGGDAFAYSELSERSQVVFKKALESGEYTVSYDGDNAPPDFSYSDETTTYTIEFESEEYTLFTYTDSGCTVE